MSTPDRDVCAVFNGEIYNHRELRRELEGLGHRFRTECDTEVVLQAFVEWDIECFERLRGMFAVAFWQESKKRLVLGRDRLGIKPLYYALHNGNVYFGSELKAIFEHSDVPRSISRLALGYFLSLNYVPGPLTLVDGIQKLPPGSWLQCKNGKVTRGIYWRNSMKPERGMDLQDAEQELDRLLESAVREHLVSDVPLGIWLSGGLDSSTILHYAAQCSTRKLETFSIGFRGTSADESDYARQLSCRYGATHHQFDVNADLDLTGAIHELAYYSDEPSADAGALPVWFLAKLTREHVTVALSGEGSDEIFGGYQTYLADRYAQTARRLPRSMLRVAQRLVERLPVSDEKIGLEYKLKRFLSGALLPADEAHFYWNGTFSHREQQDLFGLEGQSSPSELIDGLPGLTDSGETLNRYLYADQNFYLPDDILYKCDRMSMAHAVETRPPFLDHRLVEFAARLPEQFKISGTRTKRILRRTMRGKLPDSVLTRPKQGFDIPAHKWLRGPLRSLLVESLSPEMVERAGLFPSVAIQNLIDLHLSRRANLGYHLWGLMTLHLWIDRWNIETGAPTGEREWAAAAISSR